GARPQGNGPRSGDNQFRQGKPPRGQGSQGQGGYGQGGGYGQDGNNGNRQPRLTSHGQPPVTAHTQPQLTMHMQGFGNPRPSGPRYGKQNRGPGGAGQPPKQRWEGLPKDEDESK
ncbi:MAG: hypothetical protein ABI190_09640, partial [Casimicrobiaceae bacterium]